MYLPYNLPTSSILTDIDNYHCNFRTFPPCPRKYYILSRKSFSLPWSPRQPAVCFLFFFLHLSYKGTLQCMFLCGWLKILCLWGPEDNLGFHPQQVYLLPFWRESCIGLFTNYARLAGQWAKGILPSFLQQCCWDYKYTPSCLAFSCEFWGSRFLMLIGPALHQLSHFCSLLLCP